MSRFAALNTHGVFSLCAFATVLCLASLTPFSAHAKDICGAGARAASNKVERSTDHETTACKKAKRKTTACRKAKRKTTCKAKHKTTATHAAAKGRKSGTNSSVGAGKPAPAPAISQPTPTDPFVSPVTPSEPVVSPVTASTGNDTSGSNTTSISVSSGTPIIGTFGISSVSDMEAWKAAGGNAIVVSVNWAAAQPTAYGPVTLTTAGNNGDDVDTEVRNAHAAGLQVYLELDLQVPPEWVQNDVPKFVNQGGTAYTGGDVASGTVVRDWIWSEVGRQAVSSFVSGALTNLAPVLPDVSGFRVGGGQTGELQYPDDGSTVNGEPSFWAYDTPAQTGVGIASDQSPSPLPGYVYGSGTSVQDATWAAWYLDSLAIWNRWFILQLRAGGWSGDIYVLHPSWGTRTSWTPTYGPYTLELSHGADPAVMMNYYKSIPGVYPWCTWADASEPDWDASQSTDFNMAPWRELLTLARQDGMGGHVMGENSGWDGGAAGINQLMSGALASGLSGVFYLDYQTLVSQNLLGVLMDQFKAYS